MLSDDQLLKYSRQIMLPQIDIQGQLKLANSTALIIGLGGLGSPVALYLAAAGFKKLVLVDDDQVDSSNLQRQIIHRNDNQDQDKVVSAKQTLNQLNPQCEIETVNRRLDDKQLSQFVQDCDVVADCCDNFTTRFALNKICHQQKTPLVSGAAIRWEGQLTTFTMQKDTPCYCCLYDEQSSIDESCSHNGIVGPVVGIIGSMQALEVIKLITGAGTPSVGELTLFDGMDMSFNKIKYQKKQNCSVCSSS
jgi:adenylyltransferase/sulfurtransferase